MPLTDRLGVLAVTQQASGTSFTDRLIIWLHVAFVIFTIGPVTIAILSSPRYIRTRNVAVLRHMLRTTRIFGTASLGVLAFGIAAAQSLHKLNSAWITTAMTLFVVSLVLLVLIMRDQRRAVVALETASEHEALATANTPPAAAADNGRDGQDDDAPDARAIPIAPRPHAAASVERGRIASLAGIVTLIWLVILVLMVWNS
jgi:choline-glycine betaine transporter